MRDLTIPQSAQDSAEKRLIAWFEVLTPQQQEEVSLLKESARLVLVASDYVFEWAIKQPQWLVDALLTSRQKLAVMIKQKQLEIAAIDEHSEYGIKRHLRLSRHYWYLQIAVADILQQMPIKKLTLLQSLLADALIKKAYHWCYSHHSDMYGEPMSKDGQRLPMLIVAMGKLGGRELNFSSDIDLIFCYPEQGETNRESRPVENEKFFLRLGQKLITLLSDVTPEGFVYRVDMRLRPYGQSGALVSSFNALQDYYFEQGREWERFAMIKARVVDNLSGDERFYKKQLEQILRPFSFRRYIDFSVLEAIRKLKQQITQELLIKNNSNNIKLGDGGIRELEFIVQSLQLISGGRHPQLQKKNWWKSLDALHNRELLASKDHAALKDAYEFLRKLENSLQIRADKQTQQIPDDDKELAFIALLMGYKDWLSLSKTLEEHLHLVANFFKGLFHDPHQEQQKQSNIQWISRLISKEVSVEQFKEAVQLFNLNAQISEEEYLTLIYEFKTNFAEKKLTARGLARLEQLLPHLVLQASRQKNYQTTLKRCLSALQAIGKRSAYFEMLAENLPVLTFFVQLVSRSEWLAKQISLHPSLLDELLFPSNFGNQLTITELEAELRQLLLRVEPEHVEEQLVILSRFKQSTQFKIAAGDLKLNFNISQVSKQLTLLAEVLLRQLLFTAWQEIGHKHGYPEGCNDLQPSHFLIIGFGKLGGEELGYGSDLDLVFLHQGNMELSTVPTHPHQRAIEEQQFYTKVAQRLVHYLSTRTQQGVMYEVDMRLRPSGRSGLLVSHIDAFEQYQKDEAWVWEHQALVRARPVVGDNDLKQKYLTIREHVLLQPRQQVAKEVVAMRQKMREHLDKTTEQGWDLKQGIGGLVDIEFLVQYWVLLHTQKLIQVNHNEQLPCNNIDWLELIYKADLISQEHHQQLVNNYRELRQQQNFRVLQGAPMILDGEALFEQRQQIIDIWRSTFFHLDVE